MHWSSEVRKACCRFKIFVSVNYSKLHYPRPLLKSFGNSLRYKCFVGHASLVYSTFSSVNVLRRNVTIGQFRNFSSADDSHNIKDHSDEETYKNIVSDVEFQNILKDFARDFEVTSESGKILDDIKKKQEHVNEYDTSHHKSCDSDGRATAKSFSTDGFKTFSDQDASVILDYHEENNVKDSKEELFHIDQEVKETYEYATERGKTGVFDIAELIALSNEENLIDISVIEIPESYHYADYMVLVTAKSPRHLLAFTQFINKQYKMKKNQSDPYMLVEGEKDSPWKALDMGNIILHVFLKETRDMYDLESLWTLDKEYDSGGILQADPISEMMEQHLEYLNSLQPHQTT